MGGDLHDQLRSRDSSSDVAATIDREDLFSETSTLLRDGGSKEAEDGQFSADPLLEVEDFKEEDAVHSGAFDGYEKWRRRQGAYRDVLRSYNDLRVHAKSLALAREKILSYYPGAWIEEVGGTKRYDYEIPRATCLLLVGPKGSGKSSLVNRVSKVLEEDKFAPDRAQVSYTSAGDGTCFLQEYMVPRGSTSFCLYDARGLSASFSENTKMIKRWMLEGVRHGEVVIRDSDGSVLRNQIKCKARGKSHPSSVKRMVNFVILVVNGLEILKSMDKNVDPFYSELISDTYKCPFLSFKDDKPAVVVTHGDLLSIAERARVRNYLGELLGIHPAKQIFDIPDTDDPSTALATVDMLRHCLEHADRNLPHKTTSRKTAWKLSNSTCLYLSVFVLIAIVFAYMKHVHQHHRPHYNSHIDWPRIRHMWLG